MASMYKTELYEHVNTVMKLCLWRPEGISVITLKIRQAVEPFNI